MPRAGPPPKSGANRGFPGSDARRKRACITRSGMACMAYSSAAGAGSHDEWRAQVSREFSRSCRSRPAGDRNALRGAAADRESARRSGYSTPGPNSLRRLLRRICCSFTSTTRRASIASSRSRGPSTPSSSSRRSRLPPTPKTTRSCSDRRRCRAANLVSSTLTGATAAICCSSPISTASCARIGRSSKKASSFSRSHNARRARSFKARRRRGARPATHRIGCDSSRHRASRPSAPRRSATIPGACATKS